MEIIKEETYKDFKISVCSSGDFTSVDYSNDGSTMRPNVYITCEFGPKKYFLFKDRFSNEYDLNEKYKTTFVSEITKTGMLFFRKTTWKWDVKIEVHAFMVRTKHLIDDLLTFSKEYNDALNNYKNSLGE